MLAGFFFAFGANLGCLVKWSLKLIIYRNFQLMFIDDDCRVRAVYLVISS